MRERISLSSMMIFYRRGPDLSLQPPLIPDSAIKGHILHVQNGIQLTDNGGSDLIANQVDLSKPQKSSREIELEAQQTGISPEQLMDLSRQFAEAQRRELPSHNDTLRYIHNDGSK